MALGAEDYAKAKTPKGRRFLKKRAPKLQEDTKKALFLYGSKSSAMLKAAFGEMVKLKGRRDCQIHSKKNDDVRPFESGGEVSLEFFAQKSDCALFALGSHQKKRPHNITMGRMFDFHVYDLLELGVEAVRPITDFPTPANPPQEGNKPLMVFIGEEFESAPEFRQLRSLLLDFFRGAVVDNVNLKGLDRLIICTAAGGKLLLRQCQVLFKRSGVRTPRVELAEIGPSMDFSVRRSRAAPPDVQKQAMTIKRKGRSKQKNVSMDPNLGKVGRIYMPKQEVAEMALSKPKGLKRERRDAAKERAEVKQKKNNDKPVPEGEEAPAPAPKRSRKNAKSETMV